MPKLDRIIRMTREETVTEINTEHPEWVREFQIRLGSGDHDDLSQSLNGRIYLADGSGDQISDVDQASTAARIYVSDQSFDGMGDVPTPWPPNTIEISPLGDTENGILYTILSSERPTYRNRQNRRITSDDTWLLRLDATQTTVRGTGLAGVSGSTSVSVTGRYDETEVTVTREVTRRIWAQRIDPRAQRQLVERIDQTVGVTLSAWRVRGDGLHPGLDENFLDDEDLGWTVLGVAESAERGRFLDLLCRNVSAPA